ncbi:MAG: hypothetical protein WA990_07515 [Rubrobacteraceae bacterium]
MSGVRGLLIWFLGALLAFVVAAGAFILLANLSGSFSARSIEPEPAPSSSTPPIRLRFDENRLDELQQGPGQILPLRVNNTGESALSDISLTMRVTSEDTARPDNRYYRATIRDLEPGNSKTARFRLDLSSPGSSGGPSPPAESPEPRTILEVQATTPEGVSALRTAVLPL